MGEEIVLNGNSKFILPTALFIALLGAIVVIARLDAKVDMLINNQLTQQKINDDKIEQYRLETVNLNKDVKYLQGLVQGKKGL